MVRVDFARETSFLGRNGEFKCSGVQVLTVGSDVQIAPITSRGDTGRCCIEVPKESLPALITELQKLV